MAEQPTPSVGKLTAGIFLLVLLGTPLTAYLWHTLNELMHGQIDPLALLIAVPVAVLFILLLRFTWRVVEGWQAEKQQNIGGH
jgi:hypothetical protein